MNTAQKNRVRETLLENGVITRNQALSMGITRLSALIDMLKNDGYIIEGFWADENKKDYGYRLVGINNISSKDKFKIILLPVDYNNLNDLEHYVASKANKLKKEDKEVILINVFEPVLNVLSNMYVMPIRSLILLSSEKSAYINKIAFNVMDVFETVKEMFYKSGKTRYLKNRTEKIIRKNKLRASGSDKETIFILYGFNKNNKKDMEFKKYLEKEFIKKDRK